MRKRRCIPCGQAAEQFGRRAQKNLGDFGATGANSSLGSMGADATTTAVAEGALTSATGVPVSSIASLAALTGGNICPAKKISGLLSGVMGLLTVFTGFPLALLSPMVGKFFKCDAGRKAVKDSMKKCVVASQLAIVDTALASIFKQQPTFLPLRGIEFYRNKLMEDVIDCVAAGCNTDLAVAIALNSVADGINHPEEGTFSVVVMARTALNQPSAAIMSYFLWAPWATKDHPYSEMNKIKAILNSCMADPTTTKGDATNNIAYMVGGSGLGVNTDPLWYGKQMDPTSPYYIGDVAAAKVLNAGATFCLDTTDEMGSANNGQTRWFLDQSVTPPKWKYGTSALTGMKLIPEFKAIQGVVEHCLKAVSTEIAKTLDPAAYDRYATPAARSLMGDVLFTLGNIWPYLLVAAAGAYAVIHKRKS